MYVDVPVSGAAGTPLLYDWIYYAIVWGRGTFLVVGSNHPRYVSLLILDSGFLVGLFN